MRGGVALVRYSPPPGGPCPVPETEFNILCGDHLVQAPAARNGDGAARPVPSHPDNNFMASTKQATTPAAAEFRAPLRLADSPDWHESAPTAVIEARGWDEGTLGWQAWKKHLRRRKFPRSLNELIRRSERSLGPPLSWCCPVEGLTCEARDTVALVDRLLRRRRIDRDVVAAAVRHWLAEAPVAVSSFSEAVACLAWAHALAPLGNRLIAAVWWQVLEHLLCVVNSAKLRTAPLDPRVEVLLGTELPLVLAQQFPELWPCRSSAAHAREMLADTLDHLVDHTGQVRACHESMLRGLLAAWTRCRLLDAELSEPNELWGEVQEQRLERAWEHALRLARRDGVQRLVALEDADRGQAFFKLAARHAGPTARRLVNVLTVAGRSSKQEHLPAPHAHSAWAQSALLRSDWTRRANSVLVDYHDQEVRIEVECRGEVLLSGRWSLDISRAEKTWPVVDGWHCALWVSDEDGDYLELETSLSDTLRVERHVLLARRERFLLLADAVLCDEASPLSYGSRLPMAAGVGFEAAAETVEGSLVGSKRAARVLPLALPEWRRDRRLGSLTATTTELGLQQASPAGRLFAPLLIDLDPRRQRAPVTWRQLSVGQNHDNVPPHVAAAFRAQVGSRQWLVYRSLNGPANRTFLGQNVFYEFYCGRFRANGRAQQLLATEEQ